MYYKLISIYPSPATRLLQGAAWPTLATTTRSLPTYQCVMAVGVGDTALVFFCEMMLVYATFEGNSQTLLLDHFHGSKDVMASVARAFIGITIISGYFFDVRQFEGSSLFAAQAR
jgi:hypothetical protein